MSVAVALAPMDAAQEAEAILDSVWARVAGRRVPVDPVRIATEIGIDVSEADLDPDVSGAIRKSAGKDPQILLNRHDHPNRQRFSCAHELGHYVQRASAGEPFEFIDFRGPLAGTGTDATERFANAFAANLLMPADEVRSRARTARSVIGLAFEFRVSPEAMTHRLDALGIGIGGRTRAR